MSSRPAVGNYGLDELARVQMPVLLRVSSPTWDPLLSRLDRKLLVVTGGCTEMLEPNRGLR
jgi:hypothetical protein